MTKKILPILFILPFLLLLPASRAQDTLIWPQTEPAKASQPVSFTPVLYRVTGKARGNEMYLLGSIHELTEGHSKMPENVVKAFDGASTAVFELPADDLDADPAVMFGKLVPHMYLPADDLLSNYLGTAELQQLAQAIPDFPDEALLRLRPWVADMFLDLADAKSVGMKAEFGVDLQLVKRGKQQAKAMTGLETLEEQLGILSGDSLAVQASRLKQNLALRRTRDHDPIDRTRKLLQDWIAGDIAALETDFAEFRERDPEFHDVLATRRNRKWLAKLTPYLNERRKQSVFVTVGTLHLLGEHGLVRLLRDAGYKVERVTR